MQTQTLFDLGSPSPPHLLERRRTAMNNSLKNAGDKFKSEFTDFVLMFLSINGRATGEAIREAYAKTSHAQPHAWQAAGGVYARLRREGKVREVGKERSKKFGNDLAVLELVNA